MGLIFSQPAKRLPSKKNPGRPRKRSPANRGARMSIRRISPRGRVKKKWLPRHRPRAGNLTQLRLTQSRKTRSSSTRDTKGRRHSLSQRGYSPQSFHEKFPRSSGSPLANENGRKGCLPNCTGGPVWPPELRARAHGLQGSWNFRERHGVRGEPYVTPCPSRLRGLTGRSNPYL